MAVTPQFELPLPPDGQTPWGADYRSAITTIDAQLLAVRGSLFVEDNTSPTVSPGAGAKAVLTGVQSGPACRFCDVDGNRITYVGPLDKVPTVVATVNVQSAANTTLQVQIRKNGQLVAGASKKIRLGIGVSLGSVAVAANIPLSTDDFLELWVANLTGAQDVTVTDATLVTRG
jgi:hypothetical protein